jgi:hypothetical protein
MENLTFKDNVYEHNIYARWYDSKMDKESSMLININLLSMLVDCPLNNSEKKILYSRFFY